jgi:hypothetical protein
MFYWNVFFKFGLNFFTNQSLMNKIYLVFLFISSSVLYSQNIKPSLHAVKFRDDSLHVNFTHFQANKITFDFSPETPYSLYNPMPG